MARRCDECAVEVPGSDDLPASGGFWCSRTCADKWFDAVPGRRDGWLSLADLSIGQVATLLEQSGLGLVGNPKREAS